MALTLLTLLALAHALAGTVIEETVYHTLTKDEAYRDNKSFLLTEGGKEDIFILIDSTGSMEPFIDKLKERLEELVGNMTDECGNVHLGLGQYGDFVNMDCNGITCGGSAFKTIADIGNPKVLLTKLHTLQTIGGGDCAEAQLYALTKAAETASWRTGAKRRILWIGDAPGHDPICSTLTGGSAVTESSTIKTLSAYNVEVIAVSLKGGVTNGLNGDPRDISDNYRDYCKKIEGSSNQAKRIVAATRGVMYQDQSVNEAVSAVKANLCVVTPYTVTLTCPNPHISTKVTPSSHNPKNPHLPLEVECTFFFHDDLGCKKEECYLTIDRDGDVLVIVTYELHTRNGDTVHFDHKQLQELTVGCNEIPDRDIVIAYDSCGKRVKVYFHEPHSEVFHDCTYGYDVTRIWYAQNIDHGVYAYKQIIHVKDLAGPVLYYLPTPQNVTLTCQQFDQLPPSDVVAVDDCDGVRPVKYVERKLDLGCPNSFVLTRTWEACDSCGNNTTYTQQIVVDDNEPPVYNRPDPICMVDGEGMYVVIDGFVHKYGKNRVHDNCGKVDVDLLGCFEIDPEDECPDLSLSESEGPTVGGIIYDIITMIYNHLVFEARLSADGCTGCKGETCIRCYADAINTVRREKSKCYYDRCHDRLYVMSDCRWSCDPSSCNESCEGATANPLEFAAVFRFTDECGNETIDGFNIEPLCEFCHQTIPLSQRTDLLRTLTSRGHTTLPPYVAVGDELLCLRPSEVWIPEEKCPGEEPPKCDLPKKDKEEKKNKDKDKDKDKDKERKKYVEDEEDKEEKMYGEEKKNGEDKKEKTQRVCENQDCGDESEEEEEEEEESKHECEPDFDCPRVERCIRPACNETLSMEPELVHVEINCGCVDQFGVNVCREDNSYESSFEQSCWFCQGFSDSEMPSIPCSESPEVPSCISESSFQSMSEFVLSSSESSCPTSSHYPHPAECPHVTTIPEPCVRDTVGTCACHD